MSDPYLFNEDGSNGETEGQMAERMAEEDSGDRDYAFEDALNEEDEADQVFETVASLFGSAWDQFCAAGSEIVVSPDGVPAISESDEAMVVLFRTKRHQIVVIRVEVLPEPGYEF